MSTHFLQQLQIGGREKALTLEPDFDFYRAKKVLKLVIEFSEEPEPIASLRIDLAYHAVARPYRLSLLLDDVRELVIPSMTPCLFLPELEIEDLQERMMEGIRFEIISQFERDFRCACRDITILSFEPV